MQKIENWLRFDIVTESLEVGTFLRHSVYDCDWSCLLWQVVHCHHWAAVRSCWTLTSVMLIDWEAGMTVSATVPVTLSTDVMESQAWQLQVSVTVTHTLQSASSVLCFYAVVVVYLYLRGGIRPALRPLVHHGSMRNPDVTKRSGKTHWRPP